MPTTMGAPGPHPGRDHGDHGPGVGSVPVDRFGYTGNTFWACPWTTVIEDGIVSEGPVPGVTFHAGGEVEVYIYQAVSGECYSTMTDHTSGQTWNSGALGSPSNVPVTEKTQPQ